MSTMMNGTDREFGCWSSSSSSSSIGKNSEDEKGGENEAESPYKGPLDMMESLEEVLPIRRGISKFYKGKSKSFNNLAESESSTMKDLGRPENAYDRRRRNLLSHRLSSRGGISKKPIKTAFTLPSESPQKQQHLPPRQNNGPFSSCVPVLDSSRKNIHNIIC
ncbi:hypothetical protein AALP_AA5G070000 [Arabis alpina]|uniref:Uncharacterized protein n=1 Tax=Arabis alpina TaxID=50452 RepID=A0A087GVG3_ARAAL|nr:hypothetical protein AALP_AA5G070000 [Arabis alpina]